MSSLMGSSKRRSAFATSAGFGIVCLLLFAIIASRWREVGFFWKQWDVYTCMSGVIFFHNSRVVNPGPPRLHYDPVLRAPGRRPFGFLWFERDKPYPGASYFVVPLWIPTVLVGFFTFRSWRRWRMFGIGKCIKCGYDLTGNVSGICPECGTTAQGTPPSSDRPN